MSIFKKILSVVAPTLASALPGPLGTLAKKAITDALGLDADTPDEKLDQVLATANPEILAKIKAAEQQFLVDMKKLDIDIIRIAAEDTAGARTMQMATKSRTPATLSYITIGSFVLLAAAFFMRGIPEENRVVFVGAMEILKTMTILVFGFWFGSSAGSARKDDTIAKVATGD